MAPKVKKSSRNSGQKYCTPLVGEVIDSLNSIAVAGTKKKMDSAAGKWLGKMKLSVLRKIQSASKTCFLGQNQNPEYLREEIERMREIIKKQTQSVRDAAMKSIKTTKLAEPSQKRGTGYQAGKFDARVQKISEQFSKVANQLDSVSRNLQERIKNLGTTVNTVQSGWNNKSLMTAPVAVKRGPGRPPSRPKASTSPEGALEGLHKHLEAV